MKRSPLDTRTLLLQAALACFADHGFDGTSIRMIAQKAERPLSLLSHYFGSKEDLYLEVFKYLYENFHQRSLADLVAPAEVVLKDREEAIRVLREQIHQFYQLTVQKALSEDPLKEAATRLWLREVRAPRAILAPLLKQASQARTETIRQAIQVLRPDLDAGEVNFIGASLTGQVACHGLMRGYNQLLWGPQEFPGTSFQACELLLDLWLKGLLGCPVHPVEASSVQHFG